MVSVFVKPRNDTDVVSFLNNPTPCSTHTHTFIVHVPCRGLRDWVGGENRDVPKTQLTSGLSYLEFIGLSTLWLQC